jgi:N-acetylgalactosamine-6-sulfatase
MKYRNLLGSSAALLLCLSATAYAAPDQKPNVIFIFADDWGWGDLGSHGHPDYRTPHLDRMAREGTDFTQFYVNNPVCSPSRAAVMTGQYPARHGVHRHFATIEHHKQNDMPDWLNPDVVLLPRLFKEAGYKTGHFGKWHLTNRNIPDAPLPVEYGYHETAVFNGPGPQVDAATTGTFDKTIEFIHKHKSDPFFLNVWLHETHTAHFPKAPYLEQFKHLDEQHQVYAAIVAEGDHGVGRILETLDQLGLSENTMVVFSSDNGPEITGGGSRKRYGSDDASTSAAGLDIYYSVGSSGGLKGKKRSLHEGGVRVPFIVRWPGKVPAGKINETSVVTAVDLLPTFCQAAGIALPEDYDPDGESMLEALVGADAKRGGAIHWEWVAKSRGDDWANLAVRDGDWKLLMTYDGKRKELYNIPNDRAEKHNLLKQNPGIAEELARKALDWKQSLPTEPPAHCLSKHR